MEDKKKKDPGDVKAGYWMSRWSSDAAQHVLACTAALAPLRVGRAMVMPEKAAKSAPAHRNSSHQNLPEPEEKSSATHS